MELLIMLLILWGNLWDKGGFKMTMGIKDNGVHVGEKNGELELIKFLGHKESKDKSKKSGIKNHALYLAKCNCGNEIEVKYNHFACGNVSSCSCKSGAKSGLSSKTLGVHFSNYKRSAKIRNYSFDLSFEDFEKLVTSKCFYCGENPVLDLLTIDKKKCYVFNGIDRINSNFGYNLDNCVSCCSNCNYAKRSMTSKQFISWLKKAARYQLDNEIIANEKLDMFDTEPYKSSTFDHLEPYIVSRDPNPKFLYN